jgi:hypothetical protein
MLTAGMASQGRLSGYDILQVYFAYDYVLDTLYVGIDCAGICGDGDGDNFPASSSDTGVADAPDFAGNETINFLFWPQPPSSFQPTGEITADLDSFYPTFVVGVWSDQILGTTSKTLADFNAYRWVSPSACALEPTTPYQDPTCLEAHRASLMNPSLSYGSSVSSTVRRKKKTFYFFLSLPFFFISLFSLQLFQNMHIVWFRK